MEPKFSFFNAPISNITPSETLGVFEAFKIIASNQLTTQTALIRESYERGYFLQECLNKSETQETRHTSELRRELIKDICGGYKHKCMDLKASTLPYVTFSVICKKRKMSEILEFSGLICFDFDKVEDVQNDFLQIINETNPALTFISPSGNGIKAIYEVEKPGIIEKPDEFKTYFCELYDSKASELRSELDLSIFEKIDSSGRDAVRACFLCASKLTYINPIYIC